MIPLWLLVTLGVAAVAVAYVLWFRPWQLTWGATTDEAVRPLPGDEFVTQATFNATRAITINAPPEQVWPWLVQVGVTRAGWYSYDFLDNFMRPSADRIMPDLQHLAPGDIMGMSPDGKQGIAVHSLEPPRSMIWATLPDTTWVWQLDETENGSTRLITRVRSRYRWLSPSIAFSMLLEFADIWMMRKMLLNLRDRAEGQNTDPIRAEEGSPTSDSEGSRSVLSAGQPAGWRAVGWAARRRAARGRGDRPRPAAPGRGYRR